MAIESRRCACFRIALLTACCLARPGQLPAQGNATAPSADTTAGPPVQTPAAVTWGAELDFNDRYVWQGIAYSRGPVLQGDSWITLRNWTFEVWGNQILNNEPQRGQLTEYSLALTYSFTRRGWTVEPTCEKWVNRPSNADTGPNTGVCGAKFSHKAGPLNLFTTHTFDIQSFRGAYWGDAGASGERSWGRWKLEATLSGGWASSAFNEAYIGPSINAFNLVSAESSVTVSLPHHAYVRPHLEFSRIADRQLRDALSSPTLWNAGLAFGFSF